jgi:hypothetical protein
MLPSACTTAAVVASAVRLEVRTVAVAVLLHASAYQHSRMSVVIEALQKPGCNRCIANVLPIILQSAPCKHGLQLVPSLY